MGEKLVCEYTSYSVFWSIYSVFHRGNEYILVLPGGYEYVSPVRDMFQDYKFVIIYVL